jgi:hypothetical protein
MRPSLLLSFTVVLSILFSCKKEKLKSNPASFIVVNTASVNSGTLTMSDSHKITDLWLYVDDQFQGIYPAGSVMPVMNKGTASIRIYGGIVNNGIAGTRLPYKYYTPYSFSGNFEGGKTYTITPEFSYLSGTNITSDQFDSGGSFYEGVIGADMLLPTIINDPAKTWAGSPGSIYMTMTDAKPTCMLRSSAPIPLPLGGTDVYLEMDYKCNQEVLVGVIGGDIEQRIALTLRPSNGWNKIYISLTAQVSMQPTYNYYRVFIAGYKQSGGETPEIYLDNLRLVRPY